VSEIARHRVQDVRDELAEGEQVMVKVINIDPSGKIRLSRKALLEEEGGPAAAPEGEGAPTEGAPAGEPRREPRPHQDRGDRGPRGPRPGGRGPRR
jgi:polyribonucleotide nucleotidyltransferase